MKNFLEYISLLGLHLYSPQACLDALMRNHIRVVTPSKYTVCDRSYVLFLVCLCLSLLQWKKYILILFPHSLTITVPWHWNHVKPLMTLFWMLVVTLLLPLHHNFFYFLEIQGIQGAWGGLVQVVCLTGPHNWAGGRGFEKRSFEVLYEGRQVYCDECSSGIMYMGNTNKSITNHIMSKIRKRL